MVGRRQTWTSVSSPLLSSPLNPPLLPSPVLFPLLFSAVSDPHESARRRRYCSSRMMDGWMKADTRMKPFSPSWVLHPRLIARPWGSWNFIYRTFFSPIAAFSPSPLHLLSLPSHKTLLFPAGSWGGFQALRPGGRGRRVRFTCSQSPNERLEGAARSTKTLKAT